MSIKTVRHANTSIVSAFGNTTEKYLLKSCFIILQRPASISNVNFLIPPTACPVEKSVPNTRELNIINAPAVRPAIMETYLTLICLFTFF